jgi:class 3 adenylate cyclase
MIPFHRPKKKQLDATMESNHIYYDYLKSVERIDNIISEGENSFKVLNTIPSRNELSFTNGFYVYCSALFVDIRNSSQLPDEHYRPKLAKLYRTYISEIVAIMNGNSKCSEINIIGDCVSGIFDAPSTPDIDGLLGTAAQIASLIDILNYKLDQNNIIQITVGIGMSYGRALMIKAGNSGSKINDVVWMGDVVNEASKLGSYGNKTYSDYEIMVSDIFYQNLKEEYKNLLSRNTQKNCYHGNIIDLEMDAWYRKNCQ